MPPVTPIRNASENIGLDSFRSAVNRYGGGLAMASRYLVRIAASKTMLQMNTALWNAKAELHLLCEQAELPGKTLSVQDARYYGPNFKYPIQTEYSDITLTFLARDDMLEREFFDEWMMSINPNNTYDFNYKSDYVAPIDIIQYSIVATPAPTTGDPNAVKGTPTYKITLRDAFPVSIAPMGLVWGEEGFHRIAVTFAYTEWKKITDPVQTAFSLVDVRRGNESHGSVLGGVVTGPKSVTVPRDAPSAGALTRG